jgi:hypothetical protein
MILSLIALSLGHAFAAGVISAGMFIMGFLLIMLMEDGDEKDKGGDE